MSLPALQLLVGFIPPPAAGGTFILDTSTLGISGVVTTPVDVSTYVTGQLQLTRGRSRETDQYTTGSLTLTLRNESRIFDPTNTSSPLYPGIVPRAPVSLFLAGVQIFGGYVDDYQLGYIQPNVATVTISCLDGMTLLATANLINYTAAQETSGQRISHVLSRSEVGYEAPTSIANGVMTLQSSLQNAVSALSHCQAAEASEAGMLFCDQTGTLTFLDQTAIPAAVDAAPNGSLTFTDTGNSFNGPAIPYTDVGLLSATTLLFNQIQGTRTGGTQQQADDVASEAQFGIRTLSLPTLENLTDADVLTLCEHYVGLYAQPEVRFSAISVELAGLALSDQISVLSLDISSIVIAQRSAPGGGPPISQLSMVEAVSLTADASTASGKMTFGLMNVSAQISLLLDSATQGILDTSTLAF